MLQLTDVEKTYTRGAQRVVACRVAALQVAPGEQVAVVGRSGAGKTTLLNIIAGIIKPDRGSVVVAGVELVGLGESARDRFRGQHIGMVHQTLNLLQPFTALENVLIGARFAGMQAGLAKERAGALLARMGLGERLHHKPAELSLGQQQRVALCRGLVHRPQLLLADEPLGNQDPTSGEAALALMREVADEQGATLLLVTHDHDVAARLPRTVEIHPAPEASSAAEVVR